MEMVKYVAIVAVALAALAVVDSAQARGRRGGCANGSCYVGGGCANGSCYVGGGGYKMAGPVTAEGAPVAEAAPPSASDAVVSAPAAPRYTTNVRRGWFARRR
jgi:hypothetical protein